MSTIAAGAIYTDYPASFNNKLPELYSNMSKMTKQDPNSFEWEMHEQRRQGDIFIEMVEKLPDAKEISDDGKIILYAKDDGVVHEGEKSGHKHQFAGFNTQVLLFAEKPASAAEKPRLLSNTELPQKWDLTLAYVKVNAGGQMLVHPEHKTINMGEGIYQITRQREENQVGRPTVVED